MSPDAAAPRVAALVLAAGASRRMGAQNKLLARLEGCSLVERAVDAALASRADAVWVVTGHEAERVREALAGRELHFAHNPDFGAGLGTSLRAGLLALGESWDAALVCLGDMPWLEARHLDALLEAFAARPERPVCVPEYAGRRGNPVLWPARHFPALCALEGDVGGRTLLAGLDEPLCRVAVESAAIHRDVDRPEDLGEAAP